MEEARANHGGQEVGEELNAVQQGASTILSKGPIGRYLAAIAPFANEGEREGTISRHSTPRCLFSWE